MRHLFGFFVTVDDRQCTEEEKGGWGLERETWEEEQEVEKEEEEDEEGGRQECFNC